MTELTVIWIFVILVFCLDLLFVWWMFKSKKKMRRFSLIPIFLIFMHLVKCETMTCAAKTFNS